MAVGIYFAEVVSNVTFCDVLHETKHKAYTNKRECAVRTGNQGTGHGQEPRLRAQLLYSGAIIYEIVFPEMTTA